MGNLLLGMIMTGASPEQLLALKQADSEFAEKMQALGFQNAEELLKIYADDRASARAREIALRDRIPAILAVGVTLGSFGVLMLVAFHQVPQSAEAVMNIMLGLLDASWTAVISYYFGSSAGSERKTELLGARS